MSVREKFLILIEAHGFEAEDGEHPDLLYHFSRNPEIKGFHPLSHFGTKAASRQIANGYDDHPTKSVFKREGRSIYANRIKLGNTFRTEDIMGHSAEELSRHLYHKGLFNRSEYHGVLSNIQDEEHDHKKNEVLAHAIRSKGVDTLWYKNKKEDPGSTSYMITHPSQVRTVFASKEPRINKDRNPKTSYDED